LHLFNPPPKERADATDKTFSKPISDIRVVFPEGLKPGTKVYVATPDIEPIETVVLQPVKEGREVSVTLPELKIWTMLVFSPKLERRKK